MSAGTKARLYGERAGVTLELLRKFTKPGCMHFGDVRQVWKYRGDLTESGDRRMKEALGEEAYEHVHWNAVACNGGVVVVVPRWKFGEESRGGAGVLEPVYWWAMTAIDDDEPEVVPATVKQMEKVLPETRALLEQLPDLEYVHLQRVSYFQHTSGKGAKKKWREVPGDVRFFRFAGGYGCVALRGGAGKEGA